MQTKLSIIKNMIWAVCIVICLIALLVGLITAAVTRYDGEQQDGTLYLNGAPPEKPAGISSAEGDTAAQANLLQGSGVLNTLAETPDGGQEYIDNITFLCDSSLIGLRDYGMLSGGASTNQVWGSVPGNMPASQIGECVIKFPADGREIPAAQASALYKPSTLVISLGMDGLNDVSREDFIASYTKLLNDIHAASPDTLIIVCCPTSITAEYDGVDNLTLEKVGELRDWLSEICTASGVYYADFTMDICDSTGSLGTSYASANGKTLNSTGLNLVLTYLRTHVP